MDLLTARLVCVAMHKMVMVVMEVIVRMESVVAGDDGGSGW